MGHALLGLGLGLAQGPQAHRLCGEAMPAHPMSPGSAGHLSVPGLGLDTRNTESGPGSQLLGTGRDMTM